MNGLQELPTRARYYVWAVVFLGCAALVASLVHLPSSLDRWATFAVLTVAAAAAQLFPILTPRKRVYQLTVAIIFAGLFLLPPGGVALLVALAFIPEWVKTRGAAYAHLFAVSTTLISALAASAFFHWMTGPGPSLLDEPAVLIPAVVAACLYIALSHLVGLVARNLASNRWPQHRFLDLETLLTEVTLTCSGVIVAFIFQENPWVMALAFGPLFLVYRDVNQLRREARTDPKTALYNARHFQEALQQELRRAARHGRPLSVIIADLDLLRDVNNTYGHLAGDVVIRGVADIIHSNLRACDVAARFGGEEFALLLPDTDAQQAQAVAERLRRQVEDARMFVPTCFQFIRATLSLGVATYPTHGLAAEEVIHQADRAVYYAKMRGRNRVWVSSPESAGLGSVAANTRNPEEAAQHRALLAERAEPGPRAGGHPTATDRVTTAGPKSAIKRATAKAMGQTLRGRVTTKSAGEPIGLGTVTPHAIWTPRPAGGESRPA